MSDKELYINFDEYIRQGEPGKRERADAWRVAIGLQAVDGLKTSEYLQETARRNIERRLLPIKMMKVEKRQTVYRVISRNFYRRMPLPIA